VASNVEAAEKILIDSAKQHGKIESPTASERPVDLVISDIFIENRKRSGLDLVKNFSNIFKGMEKKIRPAVVMNSDSMLGNEMDKMDETLRNMGMGVFLAKNLEEMAALNAQDAVTITPRGGIFPAISVNRKRVHYDGGDAGTGSDEDLKNPSDEASRLFSLAKLITKLDVVLDIRDNSGEGAVQAQDVFIRALNPPGMPSELNQIMAHTAAQEFRNMGDAVFEILHKIREIGKQNHWYIPVLDEPETKKVAERLSSVSYSQLFNQEPGITLGRIHKMLHLAAAVLPPADKHFGEYAGMPEIEDVKSDWHRVAESYASIDARHSLFKSNLASEVNLAGVIKTAARNAEISVEGDMEFFMPPKSQTLLDALCRLIRYFDSRNQKAGYGIKIQDDGGKCKITIKDDKTNILDPKADSTSDIADAIVTLGRYGRYVVGKGNGTKIEITLNDAIVREQKRRKQPQAMTDRTTPGGSKDAVSLPDRHDFQGLDKRKLTGIKINDAVRIGEDPNVMTDGKGVIYSHRGIPILGFSYTDGHSKIFYDIRAYLMDVDRKNAPDINPRNITGKNSVRVHVKDIKGSTCVYLDLDQDDPRIEECKKALTNLNIPPKNVLLPTKNQRKEFFGPL
jgi:hypothetical protein